MTTVLVFMMGTLAGNAQKNRVTGLVTDKNNEPLLGVNVLVKGTNKASMTDFDGMYSIQAKKGEVIEFSLIGFKTLKMKVYGNNTMNVSLEEDATELDEVIVVGYGTQKKKEVTGAVVKVEAEVLEKTTTSDVATALQGQIAGVNVTSSSGQPGDQSSIVIRGYSSVMDGQNSPLYVVDGVPYDQNPQLSVSEIESIDVLKDAASASIYGTRGAGGVILITTKQGKAGEMTIRVNSEYGIQKIVSHGVPTMTSEEITYLDVLRGALNSNKAPGQITAPINQNASWLTNQTNLEGLIMNNSAPIQNHSVNVSGGKKELTYSFNANYFGQEGSLINSDYNRINLRANTKFVKDKWKITTGLTLQKDEKLLPNWGLINQIYTYAPYKPDVDLGSSSLDNAGDAGDVSNILKNLQGTIQNLKTTQNNGGQTTIANIQMDYQANKDLTVTVRGSANYGSQKQVRIVPRFDIYDSSGALIPPNPWQVTSNKTTAINTSNLTFGAIINYKKSIGKNNFTFMVANSLQKSTRESFYAQKVGNANSSITVFDGYTSRDLVNSGGNDYVKTLIGFLGRVQYNFDGKYLFSASVRRDGSSQFGPDNRWGVFPSVSAGWNVSDEKFWEPVEHVVNAFKIRASYGSTGNDRFSPYSNQSVVGIGQDYVFGSSQTSLNTTTETVNIGTTQLGYANANLKWETSIERNLGYDFSFFKNKLMISADYYSSEKKDLLFNVVNPPSTGVSGGNRYTVQNIGNMTNVGSEYAIKYRQVGKKGFKWNASLTYSKNKNRVTKTPENNPVIYLANSYLSSRGSKELVSVIREGYEAGSFFLRETDGVIKTADELAAYKKIDPSAQMGELRYVDQNGDGKIDQDDKVYKGSGIPDFVMGMNFGANYKNFDFSMQWYGSFGGKIMNGTKAYANQAGTAKDLFYSWTVQNTNSDIPWYNGTSTSPSYRGGSDYFLEDGTFVRLRNVALGYSLPKQVLQTLGLSRLRFYIQAQNPLKFTKYTGFDPEVGNSGLSTRGIDQGTYPVSAQYKLGLQLQF
ncbi:TonB-dependent receptor [Wenyingzhuangia sp. 2_MG-2023]|uniref:SusC/RagA family TonB-linked outer membrane protein n=1 Tax=Wenyingzhuangia sp. 2_MG-2023 TaxID=3062639 RepID=UPI0026E1B09C|nr:TonB-dependent receptor [Wenyingzhuangia sp. 2_MG-2023]MDO6736342.1 TonB-dependent receptor [Wenyingzhuangia sp. 2_MG-2023]